MDENTNESPIDDHSEEMEGSSNDNDDFANVFQEQSPESGTERRKYIEPINLATIGPDQQISSQSIDSHASNQQLQETSLLPIPASASDAMDTDQSEEILSRHLETSDNISFPRQYSEDSTKFERTDIGCPMSDQSTSSTKQITLEGDYSPEEENYEITKPITSKRKKEWSESYCEESGTKNESSMSQPSKTAITPDCSRSNVRTRENEETECFEGPSLSSSKKRKIEGSIDDQPPLVTHEVRSAVNMDLKATEFLTQSGKSDQSLMEIIETLPPSEQSSRGNNQEVPPQSNQAISSEGVPLTKPSEGDMDENPYCEGEEPAYMKRPTPLKLGHIVSGYIRNARGLLYSIWIDILTFREEEHMLKILEELFENFLYSPGFETEIKLQREIHNYIENLRNAWRKEQIQCQKSLEVDVTESKTVLICIAGQALISTLSQWASKNFDAIILNIRTYTILYEKFLVMFENKKIEDVQNEVSRNKIVKLKTFMEEILLRMNIVINFLAMHIGEHASQKDREKCEKFFRNEHIIYLRLKPS